MKDECNKNCIAILGGTFNPVHNGHIAMAKCLAKKKMVDEVWVMPSYSSPHKDSTIICPYDKRVEMLKIAFSNEKAISISIFEKEYCQSKNIEKSYTAIMLKGLKEKYPNLVFKFALGFDSAKDIKKWYDYNYIVDNYEFIVFDRKDEEFENINDKKVFLDNMVVDNENKFRYVYIEENVPDVSSTELKKLLVDKNVNKAKIINYMPKDVYDYIVDKKLYENN